jgi:hypothetical protein
MSKCDKCGKEIVGEQFVGVEREFRDEKDENDKPIIRHEKLCSSCANRSVYE